MWMWMDGRQRILPTDRVLTQYDQNRGVSSHSHSHSHSHQQCLPKIIKQNIKILIIWREEEEMLLAEAAILHVIKVRTGSSESSKVVVMIRYRRRRRPIQPEYS